MSNYSYVGMNRIVIVNYSSQPGIQLTYVKQGAEPVGDGGDQYTGWDRFSRLVDQRWIKSSTAVDRFQYGYDRASNRLYRANLVASGRQDKYYTYDTLYELLTVRRGTLTPRGQGLPVRQMEKDFACWKSDMNSLVSTERSCKRSLETQFGRLTRFREIVVIKTFWKAE